MAFVMRRIFHGKPGSGNKLIEICNDGNFIVRALGIAIKPRVLSDFNSGRTDRVVMEWEAESISELMVYGEEGGEDPIYQEEFARVFGRLAGLIDHAEVDIWQTH
jgi:hypothetical protein